MAKQRNSLGICVLPVPKDEKITWEQYKERFGIDLEKIFLVRLDGDYYVEIRKDFRKLIVLSYEDVYDTAVPPVSTPTQYYQSGSETQSNSVLSLSVMYSNGDGGYNFSVFADKKISGAIV